MTIRPDDLTSTIPPPNWSISSPRIAPDLRTRKLMLVDNPAKFFGL